MWLNVDVSSGMFPSERTVIIKTVTGDLAFFVSVDRVHEKGNGKGMLSVEVLECNDQHILVGVPSYQGFQVAKVDRNAVADRG